MYSLSMQKLVTRKPIKNMASNGFNNQFQIPLAGGPPLAGGIAGGVSLEQGIRVKMTKWPGKTSNIVEVKRTNGLYGIKEWGDNGQLEYDHQHQIGVPISFDIGKTKVKLTLDSFTETSDLGHTAPGFYCTFTMEITVKSNSTSYRVERKFDGKEMVDTTWFNNKAPTIATYKLI